MTKGERRIVMASCVVGGAGLLVAIVLSMSGERGNTFEEHPTSARASAAQVATATSTETDAAPVDPWKELGLPARGIRGAELLWRNQADVERILGADGERRDDGRWRFDLDDGGMLLVRYENGRSVSFEVPTARTRWADMTEAQRERVRIWFGLVGHETINGREYEYGEAFSGVGFGLYESKHIERLEKRAATEAQKLAAEEVRRGEEAARDRAARLLQGRVHLHQLSEEMEKRGFDARFSVGVQDDVVLYSGLCNQEILDDLAKRMKQSFSSFGFRRIECRSYSASLE